MDVLGCDAHPLCSTIAMQGLLCTPGEVFSGVLIRAGHVCIAALLSIIMDSLDGLVTTSEPSSNVKRNDCRFRSSSW